MKDNIYIYGASGHGKVVLDCLNALKIQVSGFIDDDMNKEKFMGFSVVRSSELNIKSSSLVFAIGDNIIRKSLAERYNCEIITIINPSAIVSSDSLVGEGTVVFHSAIIQSSCTIGKHCIINTKVSVDHDCTIGDYVHISPGATLCGNVKVGDGSWIGAGATVIQGINIGNDVVVGAGSVVIADVLDGTVVVGNPAKIIKKM